MNIFRHIFMQSHKNYKTKTKKLNLVTYFTKKIFVLAAGVSLLFAAGPSLASRANLGAPTEAPETASVAPLSASAGSPWGTPPAGTLNKILVNGSNSADLTVNSSWSDEDKYDTTFYNNILQEYVKEGSYSTEETALEIGTAAEFAAFAKYVNEGNSFAGKFVRLTSDIDLGGSGLNIAYQDNGDNTFDINITGTIENAWKSIGTPSTNTFSGTFDGGMHAISNMYTANGGLFHFLGGACLKNIIIQGNSVATNSSGGCGALASYSMSNGTTTIENCCNAANVYGLTNVGFSYSGLLCSVDNGTIKIKNCCNLGDVYARNGACSGITYYNSGSANSVVENCFSSSRLGACSSTSYHGTAGITNVPTAYLSKVSFSNCYYNKDLPGNECGVYGKSDENAGTNVKGLTTEQMQGEAAKTNMPGIADAVKDDGTPIWVFSEDGYPSLYTDEFSTDEIEITKRNLNITADDTYVLKGEQNIPDPLTYTATDSDTNEALTEDILTACLNGKLAQNPTGTDLGEYQITQGTLESKNTANAEIKKFTGGILKIFTNEFSIAKRDIFVKADDKYMLENSTEPSLTYTVTDADENGADSGKVISLELGDGVNLQRSTTGKNGKTFPAKDDYDITNSSTSTSTNYTIKNFTDGILKVYTDEFSVNPKSIANDSNITISLSPKSGIYTGSAHSPTVTVKDERIKKDGNAKTLTATTDYTVSKPTDMTTVGDKTITVTGAGNYIGSKNATYKILQGELISGIPHYVDPDGTTSVIISPETTDENKIVWLKETSDGSSAWYGLDNSSGIFANGSRFYVQWLNEREHGDSVYFANLDEQIKQSVEDNNGWLFRVGVTKPDGSRYENLSDETGNSNTTANFLIQIGDDWDKEDLKGVYVVQSGEDEDIETSYENMKFPEGTDEFGVMKLKHFSPYFIYDELTEAERAALESSKKDETVLTTETNVNGGQNQVIVRNPNGVLPSGTKVIAVADFSDNTYKIWLVDESGNSIPMPLSAPVEVSVEIPDGIDKDVFRDRLSKAGENGHFDKMGERWYVTITSNYFPIQIYLGELTDEEKAKLNKSIESSGQPKSGQEEENTSNSKVLVHEASAEENSNNQENDLTENENIWQWLNLSAEQITYISAATASFLVLLILFILIIAVKRKKKNNK